MTRCLIPMLIATAAPAANDNWISTISGAWGTAGNWSAGVPSATSQLTFNSAAGLQRAIALTAAASADSLTFNAAGGANAYTFDTTGTVNANTLTLTSGIVNSAAATQTFYNQFTLAGSQSWTATSGAMIFNGKVNLGSGASAYNLTVNGASAVTLAGIVANGGMPAGNLTYSGTGTLTLKGANTYTGTTSINSGTLNLQSAGALGTASNTSSTTVASGATLQLQNNITTTNLGTLFLSGTGATGAGSLQNVSGNNRWNSDITVSANTSIFSSTAGTTLYIGNAAYGTNLFRMGANTVTIDGPGNVWFDSNVGVSGDTGGFIKNGTGKVTFYGSNTYYTGATLVNAGSLDLIVGPFSAGIYGIMGSLTIGDNIGAAGSAVVNIASNSFANQINPASAVTLNADGILNVGAATGAGTLTFNGGQIAISSGITLTPTGNLTANTNSAHQTALISGGTVALGAGKTFTVARDATLTSDLTVSSVLNGGPLTKQGAGVLTLSGTNTLTGTTISAGTLNAQATNALGTSGTTSVTSGATLQLQGGFSLGQASTTLNGTGTAGNGALENVSGNNTLTGSVTVASASRIQSDAGSLTVGGPVALGANTLNVGGAGNSALNGAISGTGGLTKDGAGSLTLGSGSNTFSGASTINAGSIIASASNVFNNNALLTVVSGASLKLSNFSQTIGALAGAGTVDFGAGGALSLTGGSATFSGSLLGTGTLTLGAGATLTLGANFSNSGLNIVLAGGTLNLNGSTDTFGSLTITGNSILDFGNSSASSLTVSGVSFNTTALTLTVNNWVNAVDYFYSTTNPGGSQGNPPLTQFNFTGGSYTPNDNRWLPYDHQLTPAPEPATYGALFTALCLGVVGLRRRRRSPAA